MTGNESEQQPPCNVCGNCDPEVLCAHGPDGRHKVSLESQCNSHGGDEWVEWRITGPDGELVAEGNADDKPTARRCAELVAAAMAGRDLPCCGGYYADAYAGELRQVTAERDAARKALVDTQRGMELLADDRDEARAELAGLREAVRKLLSTPCVPRAMVEDMTPDQREQQRRSFVYGNCSIENPNVTRELVDETAGELTGDEDVE